MSYMALYRKWRPAVFEDVKGQDGVVTALRNQVLSGRVGHAYLFCGTRGTGKTSVAKIFAGAVNCEHPVNGSPCGCCKSCRAIREGASMDVMEIDAASNNGVDNIRSIRDNVRYGPSLGNYKVYIIDEVHMLSTGAFNALLKTLEEPPSYVIFILATTEAHKIPITVLSRCQRYDFKRISPAVIQARLRELVDAEGMSAEDRALAYISRKGDGSLRDSISLLDQCAAFYYQQTLTYQKVLDVLGAVDNEVFHRLFISLVDRDTASLMNIIDECVMQGREMSQMVTDFTWYLRNLLLLQVTEGANSDFLDVSQQDLKLLTADSMAISTTTLSRYITVLSDLSSQIRFAVNKRVLVELGFLRLAEPATTPDVDSLIERIEHLEDMLSNGAYRAAALVERPAQVSAEKAEDRNVVLSPASLEDFEALQSEWPKLKMDLEPSARASLKSTVLEVEQDGNIVVVFEDATAFLPGSRESVMGAAERLARNRFGKEFHFTARCREADEGALKITTSEEIEDVFKDMLVEADDEDD